MKIDGVKPNVVNFYKKNTNKVEAKVTAMPKDTIELSAAGKNLSALALDGKSVNSSEEIAAIKNKVNKGTYNVDSKLVAKKIIDNMKGRDI